MLSTARFVKNSVLFAGFKHFDRLFPAALIACVSLLVSGCGMSTPIAPGHSLAVTGSMHGGQQPVTGATLQLYAVGTAGDGSAATPLLATKVTTSDGTGNAGNANANSGNAFNSLPAGSFTITGDYTCPSPTAQVYLVGTGGNPGLSANVVNPALAMLTVLGQCGNLTAATHAQINELTTIGSLAPIAQYMNGYTTLGSASGDAAQFVAALDLVRAYADTASGTVPGPDLPAGMYASSVEITTLADILAGCINSDGTGVCQQLFTLATPPGGVAPTDTIGAAVDILNFPNHNTAAIFALLAPNAPFQPALSNAPASWSLPIVPVAATPSISPISGSYATVPTVTITTATPGSTIYYTTDGSAPTGASAIYTAPFTFASSSNTSLVVRAFAVAPNFGPSSTASVTYTVPTAGTASALAFLTQPVDTTVNAIMPAVKVGLVDPYGAPHAGSGINIQLSIGTNPSGGTITGTKSLNTVSAGSVSYTNLSVAPIGTGYTFVATSTLYGTVVSNPFNITAPPITFTMPGTTIGSGATLTGTFTLPTAAPTGGTTVTLSSSNPAAITVSPATVQLNAGDTTGSFTYTAVGSGAATIRASAPTYGDGTTTETTTANFITLGPLPTAPGALQNLVLTLSQPPTSSLTVNLTSSNSAVASITSSVTFPAGSTTPLNPPQIQAKTFGTSTITATGAGYAPDSRVMNVTATASLTQNLTVNKGSSVIETLTLSQASTSATTFTLKSDNTLVATVPSTVIVSANSTSATFSVTGAGVGTTTIHASATGIADTTASIGVKGTLTLTNGSPAAMLYVPATLNLTAAAVSPVSITLTSSNPAALLLSGDPNTVGSASITLPNVTGSSAVFYEQGQAAGSATVTVTSASYATVTSASIAVNQATIIVQPGFSGNISTLATAPGTVNVTLGEASGGNYIGACLGLATSGTNATSLGCKLNPGLSVSVPVLSATTATGTITSSPVTFTGGTQNVTTGFQPVAAGTSVVSVGTMPAGFTATGISTNTAFTATVAQPTFVLSTVALAGVGVTTPSSLALSIPDTSGGISVTVTAANGGLLAISTDPNAIGTSSLVLPNITNALPTLYVQGLAVGPTTLNITATGYKTLAIPFSVVAPGVAFNSGQNIFVNTSDAPYSLPLILIVNGHYCYANGVTTCFLSPGTTNQIPVATFDQNIATVTPTYTFAPQAGFAPGSIVGTGAGQTALVLSSTPPAPFTQAGAAGGFSQLSIFVTQSKITTQPVTTGANFTFAVAASISAPGGGTRTVTITSGNSAIALISTNPNAPGSAVATIPNFTGGNIAYYVQGISPGTTILTVSAPGYTTTPVALTVLPSGVVFLSGGGTFATTTNSAATTLTAYLAELNATTGAVAGYCGTGSCVLNPGISITATVNSSNTTTGTISTSQVTFTPANVSATTTFVPNEVGTSVISITQPTGFTSGTFSSGIATVSGPTILPPDVVTGAGFYVQEGVALSESPATPRSMTVTLTDPTIGRLTTDPAVMGTATSLTFDNISCLSPSCSNGHGPPFFYVQGLKPGYAKLTVTMHGYTPATATVAIYKAGFTLFSASTSFASEVLPTTGNAKLGAVISLLDPYSQSLVSDCLPSSPCTVNPGANAPAFSLVIADPTIGVFAPTSNPYDPSLFLAYLPYTGLKQGMTTYSLGTQSAGLYNTTTAGRKQGIASAINKGDLTYALLIESHDIDAGVGVEVIGNQSLSATDPEVPALQILATIADPTIAVLSTSATTVGSSSITLPSLNYLNNNFYVQGLKAGTTTITFTGGNYQSRTITVTVRPAGFVFRQFDFTRTINNQNQSVTVTPAVLNDAGQWMANAQINPQAGTTLPVSTSNPAVDTIVNSTVTFAAGATTGTFIIHPVASGSTTLTLGAPAAPFIQATTYQSVVATVQ